MGIPTAILGQKADFQGMSAVGAKPTSVAKASAHPGHCGEHAIPI
jgi:hypothetical protein